MKERKKGKCLERKKVKGGEGGKKCLEVGVLGVFMSPRCLSGAKRLAGPRRSGTLHTHTRTPTDPHITADSVFFLFFLFLFVFFTTLPPFSLCVFFYIIFSFVFFIASFFFCLYAHRKTCSFLK